MSRSCKCGTRISMYAPNATTCWQCESKRVDELIRAGKGKEIPYESPYWSAHENARPKPPESPSLGAGPAIAHSPHRDGSLTVATRPQIVPDSVDLAFYDYDAMVHLAAHLGSHIADAR